MTVHTAHPGHHITTKSAASPSPEPSSPSAPATAPPASSSTRPTPVPIENRDVVPGDGVGGSGSVDSDGLSGINRDGLRPPTSKERYWQHKFEQMR